MATKDLHASIKAVVSLFPAARTATANGTGVDVAGYESVEAVVAVGATTDGTHTITLEDSADNTTFAAVAAADLLGALPAAIVSTDDNEVYRFGYRGSKRYVRAVSTVSGATTGGVYSVIFILSDPRESPVAAQTN